MNNITLKIDDETYQNARLRAAKDGTSISAMVREFLVQQGKQEDELETQRLATMDALFRAAEARGQARAEPLKPLTRDEIYAERLH